MQSIPSDATLSKMLEAGELDGVITARAPACYTAGAPNVDRLFPDFRAAEEAYYQKARMFPIMHLLAVRRTLVESHPWLAASVTKAFYEAKHLAMAEMHEIGVLPTMLPWLQDDLKRAQSILGPDVWPYGVPDNRKEIEAMSSVFCRARAFNAAGRTGGVVRAWHAAQIPGQGLTLAEPSSCFLPSPMSVPEWAFVLAQLSSRRWERAPILIQ